MPSVVVMAAGCSHRLWSLDDVCRSREVEPVGCFALAQYAGSSPDWPLSSGAHADDQHRFCPLSPERDQRDSLSASWGTSMIAGCLAKRFVRGGVTACAGYDSSSPCFRTKTPAALNAGRHNGRSCSLKIQKLKTELSISDSPAPPFESMMNHHRYRWLVGD